MGDKINSSLDERFPFYNEADGFLYFSSQGHESLGGLDVFRFHLSNKQNQPQNLGLPVNSPQNDYAFVLYPKQDIGFVSSNKTGNDNIYQLRNMDLVSYQFEVALINEQLPLANVAVVVVDAQNNEFLNTQTDSEGIVHFNLPQNKKFTIKFIEKDCKIEYINVQTGNEIDQVKKREVFMSPIKIKDDIEQMELALYFEFNQFNITAEAAMEIERVKDILNKNPTYRLKITTHTDSRGSESYNQKLSEKRALSVREFMISKGIDPSRLQAEGKGSSQPKINCEDCTEEQHKMNRRSQFEFYID
jgi:outer membrane protein OmpA-like peptidoglycan-associated protein